MAVTFNEEDKLFILHTNHTTYQIKIGPFQTLLHLYYGKKVDCNLDYLMQTMDRSHCGNPNEAGTDRTFSMDTQLQEYSTFGMGDYRISCLEVLNKDGSCAADLRYKSHNIKISKYQLEHLPSVYAGDSVTTQTLIITCIDSVTNLEVDLYYGVVEEYDVITRAVKIRNMGMKPIELIKAFSTCLEFPSTHFDLIHFYGKHAMEREFERTPVGHAKLSVESMRGLSSHQHNPFVILADQAATETSGECYGVSFLYSGNFQAQVEVDQIGQTRFAMGIHPAFFRYEVKPGEEFVTPEAAMSYSSEGLQKLSHNFHKLIRNNVCSGKFKDIRRPVLINNWEATYFDFNTEKLVQIAKAAGQLGIEMLVMDDGWFGTRKDDYSGLGDWVVNTKKLGTTLKELTDQVNAAGLKFGIWFEPEMVNEDSDLYRKHPDWCLQIPGRPVTRCRYQLVLDLTRGDVRNYIYDSISAILTSARVEYIKWDFNRSIAEVWSALKEKTHQGQVFHDYILGLYEILDRLTTDFPEVLFEGCSSGGGRFDTGMLSFMPQIWCSDNTDAIDRLKIQYGTSFGYPISAVGSHVSAVPNHQTGRTTPLSTRGVVAMAGTFGYELDINRLTEAEKEEIKEQVKIYKRNYDLINTGDYYRLTNPYETIGYTAWQFVSSDKTRSLLSVVYHQSHGNPDFHTLLLRGLKEGSIYRVTGTVQNNNGTVQNDNETVQNNKGAVQNDNETAQNNKEPIQNDKTAIQEYNGAALMNAGFVLPTPWGDYQSFQYELTMCLE
ncbi:alpha-galactosidase [Anaerocolumna sp. AGMB13025]|uniref:alpha-galactosidase n=1 Tax=Anaerocolumna sp. AGMB13025 TaxID=3039116 RepID=UPI00241F6783|nr:alpha-galactosidase [Anaerocolumna sp. AGMB13025]WFR58632.1 alpha-galactosidase [Anaerocolumna sp. AGMB13025]